MRKFLFTLALIFSAFINVNAQTAYEKASGQYGRVDDAARIIDPRQE